MWKHATKKRVAHEDMFRLHAIIAGEVMDQGEAGRYRTARVRVGQFVPPLQLAIGQDKNRRLERVASFFAAFCAPFPHDFRNAIVL
jgi:hypothetical protein